MAKVLIDISDELYDYIKSDKYNRNLEARLDYQLRFAVESGVLVTDNVVEKK